MRNTIFCYVSKAGFLASYNNGKVISNIINRLLTRRFYHRVSDSVLSTLPPQPALPVQIKMTTQEQQMSKCVSLCQEYFGGAWHRVTNPAIVSAAVKPLSGGLSNYLYIASLPEGMEPESGEPRKVLLRFYGVIEGDHTSILKDSLVFALLSDRGIGPKLYGCFSGGRFEEYIPALCLKTYELPYPSNMAKIATAMANFHLLEMPLTREPNHIRNAVASYMDEVKKNMHIISQKPLYAEICSLKLDFQKEFHWLLHVFSLSKSNVIFCHNDVQEGNVLRTPDNGDIVLIDFEYAAYNYRGYDVANHFLEWCYSYDVATPPYFSNTVENYPTLDQQTDFFRNYLSSCGITPTSDEIDKLYKETQLFLLGPHFLWGFWSLASGISSEMNFDYMEFALDRFASYKKHKDYLQINYPSLLGL